MDFRVSEVKNGTIIILCLLEHPALSDASSSKCIRLINFKIGTCTLHNHGWGQNPIDFQSAILDFKVTEVKKVMVHVLTYCFQTILLKLDKLQTRYLSPR